MNYKESIYWLYSFDKYGSKLGLERINELLKLLDNPQNKIKTIHVTGTNGKGSICKFIGSILSQAGYNVGVYISPHLERFSERIVINNKEISKKDITVLINEIKPLIEKMISENNIPTFFEIVTAMTFMYFYNKNVDFAVVEVGLGGRYDATNVITPLVSIISNISSEHTDILGKDLKSIAFEKAGIIKQDIQVVSAVKGSGKEVIERVANEKKAPLRYVNKKDWERIDNNNSFQRFLIKGSLKNYDIKTSLLGKYQGENISLAIASIEELQMLGVYISDEDIVEGILKTTNPGRMEILSYNPMILLDGAHNPGGIQKLCNSLKNDFSYHRLILVLGILKDKNYKKMISLITPLSNIIILTKSSNPRACEPKKLHETISKLELDKKIEKMDDISKAISYAISQSKKDDLICITGSLYTVGEARSSLLRKTLKI